MTHVDSRRFHQGVQCGMWSIRFIVDFIRKRYSHYNLLLTDIDIQTKKTLRGSADHTSIADIA